LLEGSSTDDGWLVGTSGLVDVVDGTIAGYGSLLGGTTGWVVGSEVLDDVVLDQRVLGPSVDGKVAVTIWLVRTGVGDCASGSWVPSLSSYKVSVVSRPLDAV